MSVSIQPMDPAGGDSNDPSGVRSRAQRPASDWLLMVVGAVVLQLTALPIRRPLILPDESSFILMARQVGGSGQPSGFGYFPGYSILIAPVTAAADQLGRVTVGIQIVNLLLTIATVWLLAILLQSIVGDLDHLSRIGIPLVVAAYPAYRLFGALALSENLLVPVTIGLSVLLIRITVRPTTAEIVLFALVSGAAYSIHARAVVLPIAAVCAAALLFRGRRQWLAFAPSFAVAFGVAALVVRRLVIDTGLASSDGGRHSIGGLLAANANPRAIAVLPLTAIGQLFYLLVASLGLLGVGVLWVIADRRGKQRLPPPLLAFWVVVLAFSVGVSALFLNEQTGDQAIYGRYLEGVLAPLLALGLLSLRQQPELSSIGLKLSGLAVIAGAAVLTVGRGPEDFAGRQQLLNITGVFPVVDLAGGIRLPILMLIGTLSMAAVDWLRRRFDLGWLAAVGLVFTGVAVYNAFVARDAILHLEGRDTLGVVIEEVAAELEAETDGLAVCVALDRAGLDDVWFQENYRLVLPEVRFLPWDSDSGDAPCGPLIVSARQDLNEQWVGSQMLAVEQGAGIQLWATGAALDAGRARGYEPIADPDAPLPLDQLIDVSIDLHSTLPIPHMGIARGAITVTNLGPLPLVPDSSFQTADGTVNLGLEWRDPGDGVADRVLEPGRIGFEGILYPGESQTLEFEWPASTGNGWPFEETTQVLRVEVVQEGVRWTGQADTVTVTMSEAED